MPNQNLLEQAGRGVTSLFSGVGDPVTAEQQRARGNAMLNNVGLGGTMLGGGTAALVAAIGLLSALRREKEMENDARLDDDTLYISDPHKSKGRLKAAAAGGVDVSPLLSPGLALTSGIVGAGAGYALVQGVWNAIEKRRRQALLDEAQNETVHMADVEAAKSAAAAPAAPPKINLADLLTAVPVALPLLTMLATGGVTYAALDKSFPVTKRPKRVGPRRIRVGEEKIPYAEPIEDEELEEVAKEASAFQTSDLGDAGDEFLASFVTASRRGTITGDFIAKAASGELTAMEEMLKSAGIDALLLSMKGAALREIPDDRRMLGTMALFKSATLKDTVRAIAAAEYLEIYGDSFAEFAGCPRTMRKMASLGCLMGVIARDSALPEMAKQAAALSSPPTSPGLLDLLKQLLTGGNGQPPEEAALSADHQQKEDRDAALTSDAGGGIGGTSEDGAGTDTKSEESTGDNDIIDSVMESPDPGAVLTPTG